MTGNLTHLIFCLMIFISTVLYEGKTYTKLFFAHWKISSLRNEFDSLVDQIKENVDILVISETKLDESISGGQFEVPGFTPPFRRD